MSNSRGYRSRYDHFPNRRAAGDVEDKALLKMYSRDPGQAFLEVIRTAGGPIKTTKIKDAVVAAGATRAAVGKKWDSVQKFISKHPHVRQEPGRPLYEWSAEPISSAAAVNLLAGYTLKSTPAWLKEALLAVITDSLAAAETTGVAAQITWNEQRQLEKVQVLAEIAAEVEVLAWDGQDARAIVKWLRSELLDRRLEPIASPGEQVAYDPGIHDALGSIAGRAVVEVARPGYRWLEGAGKPVVVRPVVRAR